MEREWEELADRAGAPPFLRPGWFREWWGAFGEGELAIFAVRRRGDLAGVLPLAARGRTLASPANWHTPVFGPLADDPEVVGQLAGGALERSPRRIGLRFLDPEAGGEERIQAAIGGFGVARRTILRPPYLPLEGDWDGYLRERSRNLRQGIKRKRRRAAEQGDLRFEIGDGGERLEALLEEGFRVEESGWKGEAGTAINADLATRRFYEGIARWAAARENLRLSFLRLDGRAIAFSFCLEADSRLYLLKTGYDEEYRSLGPGTLLASYELERAFADNLSSYEFGGGEEGWKLQWTSLRRERVELLAFARSPLGRLDKLVRSDAVNLLRRLRSRG